MLYLLPISLLFVGFCGFYFFNSAARVESVIFAANSPAGKGAMAPRLSMAGQRLYMTWLEPDEPAQASSVDGLWHLKWARWLPERQTWTPAATIYSSTQLFLNWADAPSMIALSDTEFYAHWLEKNRPDTPYAYDIQLAHSVDGGDHWQTLGRIDKAQGEHQQSYDGFLTFLPAGPAGNDARAFWISARADESSKVDAPEATKPRMTLQTTLLGGGESIALELDGDICSCCTTTAVQSGTGPIVFYRDHTPEQIRDMYSVRQQQGQWLPPKPVHNDGWEIHGCPVNGAKAVSNGERVAVVWYTGAEGRPRVKLAWSHDSGEHFGEAIDIDGISPAGPVGRLGLAMTPQGDAIVSWVAQLGSDNTASLLLRRVGEGGATGDYFKVAEVSSNRSTGIPQLALLDNTLFLAWTQDEDVVGARVALDQVPALPK